MKPHLLHAAALLLLAPGAAAQPSSAVHSSAPVENVHYVLTFDARTAASRTVRVSMSFRATNAGPVILALPAHVPGVHRAADLTSRVGHFSASSGSTAVPWDRMGPRTWRVHTAGPGVHTVAFAFQADSLDGTTSWSAPDFLVLYGANVFLHPVGHGAAFPATVEVLTEPGWQVVTPMRPGQAPGTYAEDSYHDLVDRPFFIGALQVDSVRIDGRWNRLATYPEGALAGVDRQAWWRRMGRMAPMQAAVFGETPWETYTTLMIFHPGFGGAVALGNQRSQVGVYAPTFIGNSALTLVSAHALFHAWNGARLRPAELWSPTYGDAPRAAWLWVLEGFTDYYADLTLVRTGLAPPPVLYGVTGAKIQHVVDVPPVALADAAPWSWIHPVDGASLHHDKGSLAGLLMDILIRDATDNGASLDHVLRELYATTYKQGRGFGGEDFWGVAERLAPGVDWADFARRFIHGSEPFPWADVLPRAALQLVADSATEPRLGLTSAPLGGRIAVTDVSPGGTAARADVRPGDVLVRIGGMEVSGPDFGPRFRERYGGAAEGTALEFLVERGGQLLTLAGALRFASRVTVTLRPLAGATPQAQRILMGILQGVTDG